VALSTSHQDLPAKYDILKEKFKPLTAVIRI
jgi:hypothetical protein